MQRVRDICPVSAREELILMLAVMRSQWVAGWVAECSPRHRLHLEQLCHQCGQCGPDTNTFSSSSPWHRPALSRIITHGETDSSSIASKYVYMISFFSFWYDYHFVLGIHQHIHSVKTYLAQSHWKDLYIEWDFQKNFKKFAKEFKAALEERFCNNGTDTKFNSEE